MLDPFARTQQLRTRTRTDGSPAAARLARKIAACGPLGIKITLESAHLAIDESQAAAFARLDEQFGGLFRTQDFIEGRNAEAEGRPPVYHGK